MNQVNIYTDGACSGNPGRGGWAALLLDPARGHQRVVQGRAPHATNNEMEFTALVEAVRALKRECVIQWQTDSVTAIAWWRHAMRAEYDKVPAHIVGLAQEFHELAHQYPHQWRVPQRVDGHSGDAMNEFVNRVAQVQAGTWKGK